MKKMLHFFSLLLLGCFAFVPLSFAQEANPVAEDSVDVAMAGSPTPTGFATGRILEILDQGTHEEAGIVDAYQTVLVEVKGEDGKKDVVTLEDGTAEPGFSRNELKKGQMVVVAGMENAGEAQYYIVDNFRLPTLVLLVSLFFVLAVVLGRVKGFTSILGLAVSLAILLFFVVPQIIGGGNPLIICAIGAVAISCVSMVLAHGFNKRSGVALGSTLVSLVFAFVFSIIAVKLASITGLASEEASFLQLGYLPNLNLQGLLLGGMVIGALGVLDDVTTAQVAAIEEIHRADSTLSLGELYRRGLSVGREHIASLVNTLALAYAGASFPLFLLFSMPGGPLLWVLLNGETVAEEIIRAIVGGSALMLAVPISTIFAAYAFGRRLP